jgi:SET domain-containing protein
MILPCIYFAETKLMGRGVFTSKNIAKGTVIELSPVIVMNKDERKLIEQTILHDYIFEWGKRRDKCCIALGYIAIYNHSYSSNCEYEMDFEKKLISITAINSIKAGEELFINYNGNWNDSKPVWFKTK